MQEYCFRIGLHKSTAYQQSVLWNELANRLRTKVVPLSLGRAHTFIHSHVSCYRPFVVLYIYLVLYVYEHLVSARFCFLCSLCVLFTI